MKSIILLHGAIGSSTQLMALEKLLSQKYDVHNISLSGHGGKPFNHDFSINQFSDELITYIETNKLSKPYIFGYSMGGYIALNASLLRENLFEKIVALATKFHWSTEIAMKETQKIDPAKIELKVPAFAQTLSLLHHPNDWKLVLEKTKKLMIALGQNPILNKEMLKTISTPTLLLLGDNDEMVTRDETEFVHKHLTNSQFHLITNTRHPIEKVDVNILETLISNFCN